MGTPQYGGTLVTRMTNTITSWDPYLGAAPAFGGGRYMESPFCYDYTTDPLLGDFSTGYCPPEYRTGFMLTSFEMPDPTTFVEHFRTDIYWQNVYPANGRQFTSADVVFKYNRMLGFGGGYTTVDPFYAGTVTWQSLLSVTASDKYTVVFKWKTGTSPLLIQNTLTSGRVDTVFECPEAVAAYTTTANPAMTNWRNAVGTGPWFVSDFVTDSSVTYTANPSYWGRDLRYPQNRLPYVAEEKALIIASTATAEAAMRVGKIDAMSGVSVTDSQAMSKTNPEIIQKSQPQGFNNTVDPRNDVAPYNNINVRIALQHAINLPLIASSYYMGTALAAPAGLVQNQLGISGWGAAYSDWPQSLKDTYTYDPALAKKMLADAGFPNGFNTDIVLQSDVDKDLYSIVQSEFQAVGVNMSIQMMDQASWQAYVMTGHKQDALAARSIGVLGITTDPFTILQRMIPGYSANYIMVNDPVFSAFYPQAMAATTVDGVKQAMRQANMYVAQQHFAISLTQQSIYNLIQPWIKGNAGVNALGNFSNGIWIDQSIKKQLGH
jgi:ABC-type transport system substrate-binding protein